MYNVNIVIYNEFNRLYCDSKGYIICFTYFFHSKKLLYTLMNEESVLQYNNKFLPFS